MSSLFKPMRSRGGFLALVLVSCAAHGADVFERAQGTWGWLDDQEMSCATHPHVITFVDGKTRARFEIKTSAKNGAVTSSYFYKVLSRDHKSITMQLERETEKSKSGALVKWVLILKDSDTYVWWRDDWPSGKTIGKIVRCDKATT